MGGSSNVGEKIKLKKGGGWEKKARQEQDTPGLTKEMKKGKSS